MSLLDNKPTRFRSNHFLTACKAYAADVEIAGFSIEDLATDIAEAGGERPSCTVPETPGTPD